MDVCPIINVDETSTVEDLHVSSKNSKLCKVMERQKPSDYLLRPIFDPKAHSVEVFILMRNVV